MRRRWQAALWAGVLCSGWLPTVLLRAAETEGPRSPEEERATFRLADETLTIDLVASEPLVDSPVAICWNARGDMYVAEMRDYPVGPASGRVSRLTDQNGDGTYESATVLALGLKFPNSVLAVKGGVLVTAAPDLLFLPDPAESDPEHAADSIEPRVLLTGLAEGNQQLRANGLTWGLDNWIYGANGRSNGRLRRPEDPADGGVSIEGRDFRLKLAPLAFESVLGQSQFGQTRDDWGNRFISWNTIPLRHVLLDAKSVAANLHLASEAVRDIADPADDGRVFPISPQPQTFNRESTRYYNALCGLTIFRGDALGAAYRGNAFAGESLTNLVHRRVLEPVGPTFVSKRGELEQEFLASKDSWFHPVYLTTGPDGALYVVDFYRRWVEHPQFVPESMREKVAWQEGVGHGRIWRIRNRDSGRENGHISPLADAKERTPERLVEHLRDPNGWVRDTAQRLLVEQGARGVAGQLREWVQGESALGVVHALGVLDGTGLLDAATLVAAMRNKDARVRRRAVEIVVERGASSPEVDEALARLVADGDGGVRFAVAGAIAGSSIPNKATLLARLMQQPDPEGWCGLAVSAVNGDEAAGMIAALLGEDKSTTGRALAKSLFRLAEQAGAAGNEETRATVLRLVESGSVNDREQLAVCAGLARGMEERGESLATLLDSERSDSERSNSERTDWARKAREQVRAGDDAERRRYALVVLGACGSAEDVPYLLAVLKSPQGTDLADEVARVAVGLCDRAAGVQLLDSWGQADTRTRRAMLMAAMESPLMRELLVEAILAEQLTITELEPAQRAVLLRGLVGERAERVQALITQAQGPPRDEVLAKYREAAEQEGNTRRGAAVFVAHCSACHQLFGVGKQVGPDLTSVASRPKELVLLDVLDPSRQLAPGFMGYTLVTTEGQILSGLLAAETSEGVSIRLGEGIEQRVPRERIEQLAATGKSLMPEGFESKLSIGEVADLLEWLRQPAREDLEAADRQRQDDEP